MYRALTPSIFDFNESVSNLENVAFVCRMPCIGFLKSIKTIIMEKICNEFPDIYAMTACIGSCFAGPRAISHDFFNFKVSVSSCVGGLRVGAWADFCLPVRARVYPGGSRILSAVLDRGGRPFFRSTTHCGGGGGVDKWLIALGVLKVVREWIKKSKRVAECAA